MRVTVHPGTQHQVTLPSACQFTVFGRPQQKGTKRTVSQGGHHRTFDENPKVKPWEAAIRAAAAEARGDDYELRYDGVEVALTFVFARPKSHFGTGRNALSLKPSAPRQMMKMPDIDKLCRCALDAIAGILIADDSQVFELQARKVYGEPERLEVTVQ